MIGKNMIGKRIAIAVLLLSVVVLLACDRDMDTGPVKARTQPPAAAAEDPRPKLSLPPDSAPPPTIDSERAMGYVKEVVKLGPRPIGSANHKKVEDYIISHLKGDMVEDDVFTADTAEGKFPVRNIIAKLPGTRDGIIVIASHYEHRHRDLFEVDRLDHHGLKPHVVALRQ